MTKYGEKIAAVKLHALDNLEQRVHRFGFFDRDDAVFADLVHRLGDDRADRAVAVGRNRAGTCAINIAANRFGKLADLSYDSRDCLSRCRV